MNQRQNKTEAERLAAVARQALDTASIQLTNGVTSLNTYNAAINLIEINVSLAQVHATLATIPDPIESPYRPRPV